MGTSVLTLETTVLPVLDAHKAANIPTRMAEDAGDNPNHRAAALNYRTPSGLLGAPIHLDLCIAPMERCMTRIVDKI